MNHTMPRPAARRTPDSAREQGWLRLTDPQGQVHYLNLAQLVFIRIVRGEVSFSMLGAGGMAEVGRFRLSPADLKRLNAALVAPDSAWIEIAATEEEQRFFHFSLIVRVDYAAGSTGPIITTRLGRDGEQVTSPTGQSRLRRLLAHTGVAADLEGTHGNGR